MLTSHYQEVVSEGGIDPRLFYDPQRAPEFPLQADIREEILACLDRFGTHGIEVKTGLELEFHISQNPKSYSDFCQKAKRKLAFHFFTGANGGPVRNLSQRLDFEHFTPREILLAEIYEKFKDILEPRFGGMHPKSEFDKSGYYDGYNQEVRLKPSSVTDLLDNRERVLTFLAERLSAYGYTPDEFYFESNHLNISFWDSDGNNICSITPEMSYSSVAEKLKSITGGLLKGMHDGLIATHSPGYLQLLENEFKSWGTLQKISVGLGNGHYIQHRNKKDSKYARLEIRKQRNYGADFDLENFYMSTLCTLAGALYGLEKRFTIGLKFDALPIVKCYSTALRILIRSSFFTPLSEDRAQIRVNKHALRPHKLLKLGKRMGFVDDSVMSLQDISKKQFLTMEKEIYGHVEDIVLLKEQDGLWYIYPEADSPLADMILGDPVSSRFALSSQIKYDVSGGFGQYFQSILKVYRFSTSKVFNSVFQNGNLAREFPLLVMTGDTLQDGVSYDLRRDSPEIYEPGCQ